MIQINWHPARRELRQFAGIWLPLFFLLVGWWIFRRTGRWDVASGIWIGGGLVCGMAFLLPRLARWLYLGWMCAGFPIGWVMAHLVLGAIYFLLITPLGLASRLVGRDPLGRRMDRTARTYWTAHRAADSPESYFRQF